MAGIIGEIYRGITALAHSVTFAKALRLVHGLALRSECYPARWYSEPGASTGVPPAGATCWAAGTSPGTLSAASPAPTNGILLALRN
eukprot:7604553-Pyramimonas_sp.AAC.2